MKKPFIHESCYIAPTASVRGNVALGADCSVFFSASLRAETDPITVGPRTNIQDGCVFHADPGFPVQVGTGCTIGHGAIVHGCTVGDNTLIGMGAILLNGCRVGKNCIVGAGSIVTEGMEIPDGSLAFGSPARVRRPLTEAELESNRAAAETYCREAREYKEEN